ncbi:ABC transporter permease [Ponticoccus sp. SC2-23]|uniref:ABC transporter permease n=1 Tax=Alexandriicola marinus TaxID=2081710 RepID=UPI000FDB34A0|nr:ABC transporter permease [Alexandriicola marinus]MBM1221646.1 ABC transporter permease [Ponticoccus sp. SC6-9]MBM1226687.1 ABC transporter permease [Ponticoccus sp. SC6-15]MBM1230638.1 ABC transporter permease [Ponticoccus sp. SC6-38]MBM1235161.1 ABC transporter permease [Ponticoccus sp. SC6-45]MBM1239659.1 ABC transporter permease [Ponticoccus sp. SC6-49]MBM1243441.1 ABC transporter permease [Ponticoccus sp. SC2-64]MBM1248685.1 ABC transporter permease [Ponticoccus sp. SC6-42]MBM1253270
MAETPDNYESGLKDASQNVASFDSADTSVVTRIQGALHKTPSLVPLIVLVCAIMIFTGWLGPRFLPQMTLVFQQIQIVGILALAQTLVILTAGIDLSVGAIAVFCSVIMGQFTFRYGLPPAVAVACGLAAGAAIGAVSGWLVTRVRIPPFIATLGVWQIVLAANYIYSKNETIRARDIREEAPMLQWLGLKPNEQFVTWFETLRGITYERIRPNDTDQFLLDLIWQTKITYGVLVMIGLTIVLAYVLRSTAWGRHVYAVGDDPEAAELAGVNVKRTLMSVYMLAGLIAAIAGWSMIGRFASVSPSASTGLEGNIESITAVVIGGISLFGGRGSIWGAFFGAVIVGVFMLGLGMAGVNPQWTFMLIGTLIIVAVAIDQWIRKVTT